MERFWDMYKDELGESEAYDSIKRIFESQEDDYYERGGGYNNQRGGYGGNSSSYNHNPEERLKEMARAWDKISNFFLAKGLDIKAYVMPSESYRRGNNR